jgi:hypothetical protein
LDRWQKGWTVGYITDYHSYNYDSVKESKNYMMVISYILQHTTESREKRPF